MAFRIRIRHYFYRTGSFHREAKKSKKTLISTDEFLSLKIECTFKKYRNQQKNIFNKLFFIGIKSWIRIRKSEVEKVGIPGSGSEPKCHGSTWLLKGSNLRYAAGSAKGGTRPQLESSHRILPHAVERVRPLPPLHSDQERRQPPQLLLLLHPQGPLRPGGQDRHRLRLDR